MVESLNHVDYHKSSAAIFLDLVYYTNGIRLPSEEIEILTPQVAVPIDLPVGTPLPYDTSVMVRGLASRPRALKGSRLLFYKRLNLSALETGYFPLAVDEAQVTVEELLPQINRAYGLALTREDVLAASFVAGHAPYVLTASPQSLAWTGQLQLNLQFPPLRLQERRLTGFYRPGTVLVRRRRLRGLKRASLIASPYLGPY